MRVLVVEDERQLADSIAEGLRLHAMAVDVAYDGEAGLERASVNDHDVLDRDLPIVSGDEVCATLVRSESQTRILMLTAATAVAQRVAGLGLGACGSNAKRPRPQSRRPSWRSAWKRSGSRIPGLARRTPTLDSKMPFRACPPCPSSSNSPEP